MKKEKGRPLSAPCVIRDERNDVSHCVDSISRKYVNCPPSNEHSKVQDIDNEIEQASAKMDAANAAGDFDAWVAAFTDWLKWTGEKWNLPFEPGVEL